MPVEAAKCIDPREFAQEGRQHADIRNGDLVEGVFRQSCELQHPQPLVVQNDGARRRVDVREFVDRQRAHAVSPQQRRDRRADGT